MERPQGFSERLRKVESSRQVSKELGLAKQQVKFSLFSFNDLHSQCQAKAAKLKELKIVLGGLMPDMEGSRHTEEVQMQLEAELEETLQGLRNETHYQETLEGMLETRKIALREKKKPITFLKEDLTLVDQQLQLAIKESLKAHRTLGEAQRTLEAQQEAAAKKKQEHEWQIEQEVQQFKEKQKLLLFLRKEQEDNAQTRHQLLIRSQLQDKERQLNHMQGDVYLELEKVSEEVKQIEQHSLQEERKFKKIQSTTNITSIVDMEPYWKYLSENRERLEKAVDSAQQQIEELTREREDTRAELKNMYVDADDSFLSLEEVAFMEERLGVKIEELDDNEANLKRMEDLIAGATNSISLIAFQVFPEDRALEVKPSTSADCLLQCARELEGMLSQDELEASGLR